MIQPPIPLPPGVRRAEYTYRDGTTDTIYLAPARIEGPVRFADRTGTEVLAFMYQHFVFVWQTNAATLDIGHGSLTTPHNNITIFRGVPIQGPWNPETLRTFGATWVARRQAWAVDISTGRC